MNEELDLILKSVQQSSKYKNICEELILRIGTEELAKRKNLKEAIKATKNKLHQVAGAYFVKNIDYYYWINELSIANQTIMGSSALKEICKQIMSFHVSTKERLPSLNNFFDSNHFLFSLAVLPCTFRHQVFQKPKHLVSGFSVHCSLIIVH